MLIEMLRVQLGYSYFSVKKFTKKMNFIMWDCLKTRDSIILVRLAVFVNLTVIKVILLAIQLCHLINCPLHLVVDTAALRAILRVDNGLWDRVV